MVTIKVPFFRRADFLIPIAIATALIISVSVVSAVDLERGLVAYYSFDDCSAKDLSGNGNDGIIYGAKCVDGKFGKALSFDGVNDYVKIRDLVPYITNDWTLIAWVKAESFTDHREGIVGSGWNFHDWYLGVTGKRENKNFVVWVGRGSEFPSPGLYKAMYGPISAGQWYFIAGVREGRTLKLYINGELKSVETDTIWGKSEGYPFYIARTNAGLDWYEGERFNGFIDEVRIYNRALSEEEIRALYERGVAPRPKLAIEMDIDTSLKQGEVRKGTIRVENIGNSDAKSVKVRLFSESLGIDVEKSYARIPSGEAREFLFEVSANEAGTFKLSAYAEYWDDKGNKYVETADKFVHVEAVVLPTSQPTSQAQETPEARETARPAGFYAFFASLLMAVSYFLIRLKGKKN